MRQKRYTKISSRIYNLIFLSVLFVAFVLIFSSLRYIQFAATADEGYYLKYATSVGNKGLSVFRNLFEDYIANQQHWVFPNPLRIGFIILSAAWLKIFGYSFLNLAYLSLFSYCLSLFVSFYFIKKYFGKKIALLSAIFLTFSPLNMAMARRALIDATANLFIVSSVWLFFDNLREKKKYKTILFVLIYSSTILIRENYVLLSLFFILYLLIRRIVFKKPPRFIDFLISTVFPFIIVGIIYLAMAGDFSTVIQTVKIILASPYSNQYAIYFGSGPWYRYLVDFILLSPWVCILAIGFFINYFTKDKNEWQEGIFYLLALSLSLIFLFSFFTKNIRYLFVLDMPMRLFAILILNELVRHIFKKRSFIVLSILVAVIVYLDYLTFLNLFIQQGIYDPVSYLLLKARHIIPWR